MAVELTPMQQKVYDYIKEHKTPTTIEGLAKRFIMSTSRASSILRELSHWQLIETFTVGRTKFYKIKTDR